MALPLSFGCHYLCLCGFVFFLSPDIVFQDACSLPPKEEDHFVCGCHSIVPNVVVFWYCKKVMRKKTHILVT